MDYSSVNSELIESLEFLRPPVQRNFRNINRETAAYLDAQKYCRKTFKDYCNNKSAGTQYPLVKIRGAETSTSLIFNQTKEKITERYSVLSFTNLFYKKRIPKLSHANTTVAKQPLIKVTVIPKETQTTSVLKKRKHLAKRIQTTVSNQENSLHTKNVYLVVPTGRTKDKVYQIKTTESAKFANSYNQIKDEVIPIQQLSSLKLVLDSLNMERKKEKNKKKRRRSQFDPDGSELLKDIGGNREYCECMCFQEGRGEISPNVSNRKSFVRITGRLGLSEDDRYVLSCAATVNDKPVATDFTTIDKGPQVACYEERRFLNVCDVNTCSTRCYSNTTPKNLSQKRDCNVQTDLQNINMMCSPPLKKEPTTFSKETQVTEVDFNIGITSDLGQCKTMFPYKDEIVQCRCTNVDMRASPSESDSESNSVKGCQSPLVIISVYPLPDCSDNNALLEYDQDAINNPGTRRTIVRDQNVKRPLAGNSPVREKRNENKVVKPITQTPSPNRNQTRTVNRTSLTEPKTLRSRRASPVREVPAATNNRQVRNNKERNVTKPINNRERTRDKSPQKYSNKDTKGTNTDHNLTKKTIVDNYTKKLTAYMDNNLEKKLRFPKNDTSKIAVDIDAENEHYDVYFQQDNATTDFKVKKTVKSAQNRQNDNFVDIFPSTKKVLVVSDDQRRRNEQLNDPPLINPFSRLQMRDSLEISHRHDVQTDKHVSTKTVQNKDDSSEPFSAPIKHYRGDKCPITDPIKRDKEIRTLLGIDKGVHASIAQDVKFQKRKYAVPLHYYFNKTCEKKILTGINYMGVPPCVCCDIRKKYYNTSSSGSSHQVMGDHQVTGTHEVPGSHHVSGSHHVPGSHHHLTGSHHRLTGNHHVPDSHYHATGSHHVPGSHHHVTGSQHHVTGSHHHVTGSHHEPGSHHHVMPQDSPMDGHNVHPFSQHANNNNNLEDTDSPGPEEETTRKSAIHDENFMGNNHTGTQYETQVRQTSLYQQLILNRNIQVFLQVEQFSKQRPVVLSRKQYDKVKKTIENTIANRREHKRKKCICRVSVGDVRKKTKQDHVAYYERHSKTDKRDLGVAAKRSSSLSGKSVRIVERECACEVKHKPSKHTLVLFSKETKEPPICLVDSIPELTSPRQAVSSIDLRFASMSYMNHVTFSSTNVEVGSTTAALAQKESHSLHTLFKGHRKCHTPNLGTSIYSLCSEEVKPMPVPQNLREPKKKPFLRRLMSCLVMRSTHVSDMHNAANPSPKVPTVESSIDSYHISTSLGAIEVSSSIYDTSASFYTNHSVYPVNSKMKRGFFNSVREFLTNRKS